VIRGVNDSLNIIMKHNQAQLTWSHQRVAARISPILLKLLHFLLLARSEITCHLIVTCKFYPVAQLPQHNVFELALTSHDEDSSQLVGEFKLPVQTMKYITMQAMQARSTYELHKSTQRPKKMDANDVPSSYPYDSRISLDYTYSMDKLSCVRELYFIHITFAYLVVLSGIACFTARLYPPIRQYHALFGRAYIVCMLWCMASSLLVHNTGLPVGVLISFFIVLFGLTAGWVCAKLHQNSIHASVLETVQKVLLEIYIYISGT
jgi:hypothetical protein